MFKFSKEISDISVERELILTASPSTEIGMFLKKNKDFKKTIIEIGNMVEQASKLYQELLRKKNSEGRLSIEDKRVHVPNLLKLTLELKALKNALQNFRMEVTSINNLALDTGEAKEIKRMTDEAIKSIEQMR